ncbi:MAG: tetratricopeptide repeat protein [Planctomycetales bacterium]|nr:tetratricopeptide repeat protein [Planctomycetales bacterium]
MRKLTVAFLLFALLACWSLDARVSSAFPGWPFSSGSSDLQPGTPDWWKKYKKKAVFVPHHGYQVEGFDGYFDADGRSIAAPALKKIKQEKGSGGLLNDVSLNSAFADVKQRVGLGPDQVRARTAFDDGEKLFREEKYGEAAKRFQETISRWPDSQLEQDALFQLAECRFFAKEYPDAVDAYDQLLAKYPNSPHLDRTIVREFDIARFWEKHHAFAPHWPVTPNLIDDKRPLFDTLGRAIKIYENIRLNDPTGPLADDAVMATANSYFLRGRYGDADYHYQLLRNEYPRSEHQYEAHMLGLQCKLHIYQGPDYDGVPLEEAKAIIKQLRMQFAGQLDAEQRDRLAKLGGQITREQAARHMHMGSHFENTGYNRSAKYYYAQVVRENPDGEIAAAARARLEALAEAPDEPEPPLKSIIDMLPENAERNSIAQVPLINKGSDLQVPGLVPGVLRDSEVGVASRTEPVTDEDGPTYQR